MKISSFYPRKYLNASDLPKARPELKTILSIDVVSFPGADPKPVLHFLGGGKGLVLNATNARTLAIAWGDESDRWIGRTLELRLGTAEYDNQPVPSIEVRVPRTASSAIRRHQHLPLEATLPFHRGEEDLAAEPHPTQEPHG